MKLTDQLRQAVRKSGLSQAAICRAVGMPESQLSAFLSGQKGFCLPTLDRLGDVLRLQIARRGALRPSDRTARARRLARQARRRAGGGVAQ